MDVTLCLDEIIGRILFTKWKLNWITDRSERLWDDCGVGYNDCYAM